MTDPEALLNNQAIQVEVGPIAFSLLADGRVQVDVRQMARGLTGGLWSDIKVRQFYTLGDGQVSRMDVTPFEEPSLTP
jgi:hypothetical protein